MVELSSIVAGLQIAVAVLVIILLYHLLFVAVDLRRILRRLEGITSEVEDVIMKPISMADSILQWITDYIEADQKKKISKKSSSKK